MNLEQEKDLVERAKYSSEAFGELYDMYYDQIFVYTLRRSADIDSAKDITSEVFFKALKNIGKFRWQGVPFSHWLYRIANREIIDHYHNTKRELNYEKGVNLDNPDFRQGMTESQENIRAYDDYLDLHKYLSRLSSKHQEVIALRYFEDLSMLDIAQILQKPEGTVKSTLHRGIDALRKMIEAEKEE
ncbi:MAG: RNA polymerase sigma factor [Dehalococcoidales bacterium]|nr:MAG: RNA polymerase sigma factor [Dehalococcoidales bacterium]